MKEKVSKFNLLQNPCTRMSGRAKIWEDIIDNINYFITECNKAKARCQSLESENENLKKEIGSILSALNAIHVGNTKSEPTSDITINGDIMHCPHCGKDKHYQEFYPHRNSKTGFTPWCRECTDKHLATMREKSPRTKKRSAPDNTPSVTYVNTSKSD